MAGILRTPVMLSYVSSIVLFLYQFIAWNYDIQYFSDHGILLRLQTMNRNEFNTLALSQYLPFACNTIAILYESPLIFSLYSVYAVVVFAHTLYEWWVPYVFGCCGRWDEIGFDQYHLEYGMVHKYKVLPELVKGYPVTPGLEQIGK